MWPHSEGEGVATTAPCGGGGEGRSGTIRLSIVLPQAACASRISKLKCLQWRVPVTWVHALPGGLLSVVFRESDPVLSEECPGPGNSAWHVVDAQKIFLRGWGKMNHLHKP